MKRDDDDQFRVLLREWKTPEASATFEQRVMRARGFSWAGFWQGSIRVPLPVAGCLVVLMALGAWKYSETVPLFSSCAGTVSPVCSPNTKC
ncbi:MAG: hypothetical protein ABI995_13990 [Acidobacteriota bacterium]